MKNWISAITPPQDRGWYLITRRTPGGRKLKVELREYDTHFGGWIRRGVAYGDPIAWMPLPEPYNPAEQR